MGRGERAHPFVTFLLFRVPFAAVCLAGVEGGTSSEVLSRREATAAASSYPFSTSLLVDKNSQEWVGLLCSKTLGNMTIELLVRGLPGRVASQGRTRFYC